jgi:pyruvate oxidase
MAPEWHRVLGPEGLPEGRVAGVHAGVKEVALVHHEGKYVALDNRFEHDGPAMVEVVADPNLV